MTDPHFDRALRAAARRGRPAGPCPDASLLAAYVDRGLSAPERASIERHLADCANCMEQLALLAAVDLADEPSPAPALSWDPGRLLRRWGWLVPVATVVLLVAIWVRMPAPSPPAAATGHPAAQAQAATPARQAPAASNEPRAESKDESLQNLSPRAVAAPARKAQARDEARPAEPETRENRITDALKPKADTGQPAAAPAAPSAMPEAVAPSDHGVAGLSAGVAGGRLMAKTARPLLIVRATDRVLIRAAGSRLERSTDGGATWIAERTEVGDALTVGTCPADGICWLAGADVAWVRGATGTWTRRPLPSGAAATGISAVDARQAVVSRADGTTLSTGDGGLTWTTAPAP